VINGQECDRKGCRNIERDDGTDFFVSQLYLHWTYQSKLNPHVAVGIDGLEHLAGPDCICTEGYSGWRVSVEEMQFVRRVQCLHPKTAEDWVDEEDDEEFETTAECCFLTGVADVGTDEFNVNDLEPERHDVSSAFINNETDPDAPLEEKPAMPFHPKCFEMFRRMSIARLGKVDIDGLWLLREVCGLRGDDDIPMLIGIGGGELG
jgi:hypothetical protein